MAKNEKNKSRKPSGKKREKIKLDLHPKPKSVLAVFIFGAAVVLLLSSFERPGRPATLFTAFWSAFSAGGST